MITIYDLVQINRELNFFMYNENAPLFQQIIFINPKNITENEQRNLFIIDIYADNGVNCEVKFNKDFWDKNY